jgi:hypothetical protein
LYYAILDAFVGMAHGACNELSRVGNARLRFRSTIDKVPTIRSAATSPCKCPPAAVRQHQRVRLAVGIGGDPD